MRTSAWILGAAIGCGSDSDKGTSPSTDSGDSSAASIEITYPTGDRVLLYYGHGGLQEEGTGKGGFEDVDAHLLGSLGWSTDHRDYFATDLSTYRLIGLVGVGMNGGEAFSPDEVTMLNDALDRGTRLVLFADRNECVTDVATKLLQDLGVGLRFTGEAADFNRIIETSSWNTGHQIGTDVQTVRFKEPCWVDATAGTVIAQDDQRNAIIASARPRAGGEVVLSGDFQFFDDSGYLEFGDNARLIENFAIVTPVE